MNRMQKLVLTIAVVAAILIPLWLLVAVPERWWERQGSKNPRGERRGKDEKDSQDLGYVGFGCHCPRYLWAARGQETARRGNGPTGLDSSSCSPDSTPPTSRATTPRRDWP